MPDEAHSHEQARPPQTPAPQTVQAPPAQAPAGAGPLSVAPSAVGNKTFSAWTSGPGASFGSPPPPAAGNRAMARWASGGSSPVARAPVAGNAPGNPPQKGYNTPLARSVVARQNPPAGGAGAGASTTDGPSVPFAIGPFLSSMIPTSGSKEKKIEFPKKEYNVGAKEQGKDSLGLDSLPKVGLDWSVSAGATMAIQGGGLLKLERAPAGGDNVTDSITGSGGIDIMGGAFGRISAGIGAKAGGLAGVSAGVQAQLKIDNAKGKATFKGNATRTGPKDGVTGAWGGGLEYGVRIDATLSASAQAYFEWNFLWWGKRYTVNIGSFRIGTVWLDVQGKVGLGNQPSAFPTVRGGIVFGKVPKPNVIPGPQVHPPPPGAEVRTKRFDGGGAGVGGAGDSTLPPVKLAGDGRTYVIAGPGPVLGRQTEPPPQPQPDPNAPAPPAPADAGPVAPPTDQNAPPSETTPIDPNATPGPPVVSQEGLQIDQEVKISAEEGE